MPVRVRLDDDATGSSGNSRDDLARTSTALLNVDCTRLRKVADSGAVSVVVGSHLDHSSISLNTRTTVLFLIANRLAAITMPYSITCLAGDGIGALQTVPLHPTLTRSHGITTPRGTMEGTRGV